MMGTHRSQGAEFEVESSVPECPMDGGRVPNRGVAPH